MMTYLKFRRAFMTNNVVSEEMKEHVLAAKLVAYLWRRQNGKKRPSHVL